MVRSLHCNKLRCSRNSLSVNCGRTSVFSEHKEGIAGRPLYLWIIQALFPDAQTLISQPVYYMILTLALITFLFLLLGHLLLWAGLYLKCPIGAAAVFK